MHRSRRNPYLLAAAICLICGTARANGIIHDPAMGVERGDLSTAIFQGANFVPAGAGGGVFGFYNASVNNITELMFQVLIAPNLDLSVVQQSFACDGGNANPFFFYCSIQYVQSQGLLGIAFWGTYPAATPGTTNPLDEVGLHMGIPPLTTGCAATPDAAGCTDVGHFTIVLNDNFAMTGTDGGWNNTNSPGLFTANGVTFVATQISTVYGATPEVLAPEPATFAMMGGALIGLGWLTRRRTKKRDTTSPAAGRTPGASTVRASARPV